ncbi:MAG: type I 3-dehydroquinate dehydratase [Candidatus Kapaibacteriota bacterium]
MNLQNLSKICLSIKYFNDNTITYAKNITNLIELRVDNNYLYINILQDLFDNFNLIIIKSDNINDYNIDKLLIYKEKLLLDIDYNQLLNNVFILNFLKKYELNYIISNHNIKLFQLFENDLYLLKEMLNLNPNIVKIVLNDKINDWKEKQVEIYEEFKKLKTKKNRELICFFEGEKLKESRLFSLKLGAPFTYCSYDDKSKTGNGQFTCDELKEKIILF